MGEESRTPYMPRPQSRDVDLTAIPGQLILSCPDPRCLTGTLSLVPTMAGSRGRVRGGTSPNMPIGDQLGPFTPYLEPDVGSVPRVSPPNDRPRHAAPDYDVS